MTPEEIKQAKEKIQAEHEKIKDQPLIFEDGRLNHKLAGLLCLSGFLEGLTPEKKHKREPKRNNLNFDWKHKKKGRSV